VAAAAVLALVVGDVFHVVSVVTGDGARGWGGVTWLVAMSLWGAAALDVAPQPLRLLPPIRPRPVGLRVALFAGAVVVANAALAPVQLHDRIDRLVFVLGISAVSLLALARTWGLMRGNARLLERQREMAAERERAASLLEAAVDASADGMLVTNLEGDIVLANAPATAVWGLPHDALVGDQHAVDARLRSLVRDFEPPVDRRRDRRRTRAGDVRSARAERRADDSPLVGAAAAARRGRGARLELPGRDRAAARGGGATALRGAVPRDARERLARRREHQRRRCRHLREPLPA
jgi:PAS domain-containing protein